VPSWLYLEKEQVAKAIAFWNGGVVGRLDGWTDGGEKGTRKSMNSFHSIPFHQMVKKMEFKVFHPTRFYFILLRKTRFTTTTTTFVCLFTTLCAFALRIIMSLHFQRLHLCTQNKGEGEPLGVIFLHKIEVPPPRPQPLTPTPRLK
jgi:hypothetical protein